MITPITLLNINEYQKTFTIEIDKTVQKVKDFVNFENISILFTLGIAMVNINFAIITASCYLSYKIITIFYKMCNKPVVHDSKKFLEGYKSLRYPVRQRALIDAFNQTKVACTYGFKVLGKDVFLDKNLQKKCIDETFVFTPKDIKGVRNRKNHKMTIEVVNEDTFYQAEKMINQGYNPLVLNMANQYHPGGGVESGSRAQEESLFRRSNYFQSLYNVKSSYPLDEYGAVYSPHVQVFRKSEKDGLEFQKPFEISCIAAAAYDLGKISISKKQYDLGTKEKIRSILRVAKIKGHDSLVLGALGCGAFRGNPKTVSKLFKEVLNENEFNKSFRKISFAIFDDQNAKQGSNFQNFKNTFRRSFFNLF